MDMKWLTTLATSQTKNIQNKTANKRIKRGGQFDPGRYAVTIVAVDVSKLETGNVLVTFEDSFQAQHRQMIWIENFNKDGISDGFETLLFGLFEGDEESMVSFFQTLANPKQAQQAFHFLRGMKLTIEIAETDGYLIVTRGGQYYCISSNTGETLAGPYPTKPKAKDGAKANDLREPKSMLVDTEPTHAAANIEAIQNSIKAVMHTESGGNITAIR